MCATCNMAVTFPSNGTDGSFGEGYEPVGSVGPTFANSSVVGSAGVSCAEGNTNWTVDNNECSACCWNTVTYPCLTEGGNGKECEDLGAKCISDCSEYLGYSPLDAPTAFLLALVAAYGAIAVYRKRMQKV